MDDQEGYPHEPPASLEGGMEDDAAQMRWKSMRELVCLMAKLVGEECEREVERLLRLQERGSAQEYAVNQSNLKRHFHKRPGLGHSGRSSHQHKLDARRLFTINPSDFERSTTATVTAYHRTPLARPTVVTHNILSDTSKTRSRNTLTTRDNGSGKDEYSSSPEQVHPTPKSTSSSGYSRVAHSPKATTTQSSRSSAPEAPEKGSTKHKTAASSAPTEVKSKVSKTKPHSTSTKKTKSKPTHQVASYTSKSSKSRAPAETSKVIHVCIAREPESSGTVSEDVPMSTFTSSSKQAVQAGTGKPSPQTVYDYNCSISSSSSSSSSSSPPTLLTSTTANFTALSPIATSSVAPHGALPNLPNLKDGADIGPTAFFATPGGKGTIAGISIGSAALTVALLLFLLWRKKTNRESGTHAGVFGLGRSRISAASSTSSFGDSTTSLGVVVHDGDGAMTREDLHEFGGHSQEPEMTETLRGQRGSFIVESRRYEDMPPWSRSARAAPVAASASAAARPQHSQSPPQGATPHSPSSNGHSELATSSDGYDPFADISSNSHGDDQALPLGAAAMARGFSNKHERRKSGFTTDTYRSGRRSRPLSVRNPDSDEANIGSHEAYAPSSRGHASGSASEEHHAQAAAIPALPTARVSPSVGVVSASPERSRQASSGWTPWKLPSSYSSSHGLSKQQQHHTQQQQQQQQQQHNNPHMAQQRIFSDPKALPPIPPVSNLTPMYSVHPAHPAEQTLGHRSRPSFGSDAASSRSSLVFNPNFSRSWVNDGNETPHDVQDVQLGVGGPSGVGGLGTSAPQEYFGRYCLLGAFAASVP